MKKIVTSVFSTLFAGSYLLGQTLFYEMDFNDQNGNQSLDNRGSISVTAGAINSADFSSTFAPVNGAGFSGELTANTDSFAFAVGSAAPAKELSSFTVGGWFRIDSINSQASLFSDTFPSMGLTVLQNASGEFPRLGVESTFVSAPLAGDITLGQWTFIAATYDGTQSSNNVNIYSTTSTSSLNLIATGTIDRGVVADVGQPYRIGSNWTGLADNVRFYGSKTDASGVLSSGEITTWMQTPDVIPEPSSYALFTGLALVVYVVFTARGRGTRQD